MPIVMMTLLACAPELAPEPSGDTLDDTGLLDDPLEETTDSEGLTISSVGVDATDYKSWVYFDLDTGEVLSDEGAAGWDVALQRYHFALNGGVIGAGAVAAAVLEGAVFDDVTTAPADGYTTDAPDADKDGVDEYVLDGWYDYDPETHILTPAAIVYVIQTDEAYHRFEVLDYYNDAGTSGHLEFRWGAIAAPDQE